MRLSHSLQLTLPVQILSATINAVSLNSSQMYMIVTLPSSMGSSQRVMSST